MNAGVIAIANPLALQNSTINTAGAGTYDITGITTPTIGGLSGSNNLASVITTGYGSMTSLTLNRMSGTQTYAGSIAEGAAGMSLTKAGVGTQVLSASSTYTGGTLISGGKLVLDATGSIDGTSQVSLGTGGTFDVSAKVGGYSVKTLVGSGTVAGGLTVRRELAIGNSPGTITLSGGLGAERILDLDLRGAERQFAGRPRQCWRATEHRVRCVAGSAADRHLHIWREVHALWLQHASGHILGLADLAYLQDNLGNSWQINYADATPGANGGAGAAFVTVMAVPEPGSLVLAGLAGVVLLTVRRWRR